MPISTDRQLSLALKWIVKHARKRSERSMKERLAAELVAASKGQGNSIKKRDELHKMAESNRAFAHFRWSYGGHLRLAILRLASSHPLLLEAFIRSKP